MKTLEQHHLDGLAWPGLKRAVQSLCARAFLAPASGGDDSIILEDGSRYIYTAWFWEFVGTLTVTRRRADGEPEAWQDVEPSPANVAAMRARIAAVWIDVGAPRPWAEHEADAALAFEAFVDMQYVGWLRA
jgi:hypothetical protein